MTTETMRILRGESRHVDAVWALMRRCRGALEAEGVFQWDDVYPTRATVETDVGRRGCASVRLDAYTANPRSVALYRRRGYREVGQVRFPRRAEPFWCFELPIDKPRGDT